MGEGKWDGLRKAAEAAIGTDDDSLITMIQKGQAFRKDANPAAVLELLNDLQSLQAENQELRREVEEAHGAINWACGCGMDEFMPPMNSTPRYWWRSDLAKRARLVYDGGHYVRNKGTEQNTSEPAAQ